MGNAIGEKMDIESLLEQQATMREGQDTGCQSNKVCIILYSLKMTDYTPPERIFVSFDGENIFGDTLPYASFNQESDTDTEYIRADLVDSLAKKSLIADNKRLTEQLEAAKRQGAIEALERCWNDGKDSIDVALAVNRNLSALKADFSSQSQ